MPYDFNLTVHQNMLKTTTDPYLLKSLNTIMQSNTIGSNKSGIQKSNYSYYVNDGYAQSCVGSTGGISKAPSHYSVIG